jgi:hypothetical protein
MHPSRPDLKGGATRHKSGRAHLSWNRSKTAPEVKMHRNEWGRMENATQIAFLRKSEKIGVPRLHENMLPGNSFPQICVVSVNQNVENKKFTQEYLIAMAESNLYFTV